MPKAIITRACEYMGHQYVLGEEVTDTAAAAKLTRLGFAGWEDGERPAAPPPQSGRTDYDPTAHNAEDVKAYAEGHPTEVSALIAKETDGKNRPSVIAALNAILNAQNEKAGG